MFSGIIEDVGTVAAVRPRGNGRTLVVRSKLPMPGEGAPQGDDVVKLGDSISVMGVCLTVEAFTDAGFTVAVGKETLERSTLGDLRPGSRVHLERALRVNGRLDGHIVSGHVDGVGRVRSVEQARESVVIWTELPQALTRYVAEKGSVTIDGTSLTVNELDGRAFRVNIVPYTAAETCLGALGAGSLVNIEVDVLARYLERLLGIDSTPPKAGGLTAERLAALGFAAPSRGGTGGH